MNAIAWFIETWPQLWQVWMAISIVVVVFLLAWGVDKYVGPPK